MAHATIKPAKLLKTAMPVAATAYKKLYLTELVERFGIVSQGISAIDAKALLALPQLGRNATLRALDLPIATFNKKVKARAKFSAGDSERIVGFARLVGQVEMMAENAGAKDAGSAASFDAKEWLARWLDEPLPALGGVKPLVYLKTVEGQRLISQMLDRIAASAYA